MNNLALPLIKSVTDLRYQTPALFKLLKKKKRPLFIAKNNKMVGVLLSPKIFVKLWESYEDWRDQKIIDELIKASSPADFLDFEKFEKKKS